MAVKSIHEMWQPQRENALPVRVWPLRGQTVMGLLFLVALLAFEIFNFDTTRFALTDFLGGASFAGLRWATVLAIAFCAIDFAGLLRFFLPQEEDGQTPTEVWYLMGAWLLGATMNALMTWWAVNLALLGHDFGNEVLSRAQLLEVVPIFVATLVWITRILFIGAFTVAGGYLFNLDALTPDKAVGGAQRSPARRPSATPLTLRRTHRRVALPGFVPLSDDLPPFLHTEQAEDEEEPDDNLEFVDSNNWPTLVSRNARAEIHREG